MAQIDSNATLEEIAQVELKYASWRRFVEEQRAAELARLSDVREAIDGQGSTWTYVVVDGVFGRARRGSSCSPSPGSSTASP